MRWPTTSCARLRRPREGGFTLVELMMGSFVLAVSLLGMLGLVATSFGMSRSAHEITTAKNAAMRKLEEVRELARTNFPQVATLYANQASACHFDAGGLAPSPGDGDQRTGLVTVSPCDLGTNLLDVVVRVEWHGCGGPRAFELRSRVSGN